MRSNINSVGIIILTLILSLADINLFANDYTKSDDGITIIKSDTRDLILTYKPVFNDLRTIITVNGEETYLPDISGVIEDFQQSGEPLQLVMRNNITVPGSDKFELLDYEVKSIRSYEVKMAPGPTLLKNLGEEEYKINPELYKSGPPDWVSLNYTGIARGTYLSELNLTAARYNTSNGKIEIPGEIYIHIRFYPEEANFSNSYSEPASPISLNYKEAKSWKTNTFDINYKTNRNKSNSQLSGPSGKWYKIEITSEGVYKIDASTLSDKGINISRDDVNTIKIYGNGGLELSEDVEDGKNSALNEQEIIVNTNSSGDLSSIIFYASPAWGFEYSKSEGFKHYFNHYAQFKSSKKNIQDEVVYYLLTWGSEEGKRATETASPEGDADYSPKSYIRSIFFEEDLENGYPGYGAGRMWLGGPIYPSVTYTNVLQNLDRDGQITYKYSLGQVADGDCVFKIYENNNYLSYLRIDSNSEIYVKQGDVTIDATMIASDNRSELKIEYVPDVTTGTSYFDWYEIHYPRSFVPINNELSFFTDPDLSGISEYNLNNFSGTIYGYDVTDVQNPKLLKNDANTGGMFVFKAEHEEDNPKRFFVSSNMKKPASIESFTIENLRTNHANTDVIVITHKSLLSSANAFKEYREANSNLSVSVVTTQSIFNEFSYCTPDPTGIRDFISNAYYNWDTKPKYIVIWGDGHYDFRSISTSTTNFVPAYQKPAKETGLLDDMDAYATDDYYVKVEGSGYHTDIPIGRITVDKPETGDWMVEKIAHYEHNSSLDSWRTTITLLADDSQKGSNGFDGSDHTRNSENIADELPDYLKQNKIYLVEYPRENLAGGLRKPKVTEAMVSTVNTSGTFLMNWMGHGNPRVWAHEEIFERSTTVPLMHNMDKLFFTCAGTCDFGRFDMTDTKSGAEEIVLSKYGSSIGILSATRGVYGSWNEEIIQLFYHYLFTRNENTGKFDLLGDVLQNVKQHRINTSNDSKFYLLGDPTMRLLIPDQQVRIDSINGVYVAEIDTAIQLKALSDITISGTIIDSYSKEILSGFNGMATLTVLDCEENINVEDIDGSIHNIDKPGGALNRGSYQVTNGAFTASFIMPKDISFANDSGSIYVYAVDSVQNLFAMGESNKIIIGGIDDQGRVDSLGPIVDVYLETRKFLNGDIVCSSPLLIIDLADESGINTTGRGIGHRIEAWMDDDPLSTDLTDKFANSPTDSKAGTVEDYLFDLSKGKHKLKVRAWDVLGNYTIEEVEFVIIPDEERIYISELYNYPNPVEQSGSTIFKFIHNIVPPFDAELSVYSRDGRLIKTINQTISSSYEGEITWDITDSQGCSIPSGVYLYQLILTSGDGTSGKKSAILNYIK